MPKVTEAGATNAWEPGIWTCAQCGAGYTAGAPACPECRSQLRAAPEEDDEAAEVPASGPPDAEEPEEPAADGEPPAPAAPRLPPRRPGS
jgi:hypothetical protein